MSEHDPTVDDSTGPSEDAPAADAAPTSSAPRECPVCGQPFERETRYGVEIDVCTPHGVWLDRGELRSIVEELERRGLARDLIDEQVAHAASHGEQGNSGFLYGVLLGTLLDD